jgi:hypothetical protein
MNKQIAAAVFDSEADADRAVSQLRSAGVPDSAVAIIAQHDGKTTAHDAGGDKVDTGDNKGSGVAKGLGIGAGVGALFGIAALAIPGIGPFVTAGFFAESLGVAGGAAASGAIVGATAGGLTSLLTDYGVSKHDADYYEQRIKSGGVFVAVDTGTNPAFATTAADILRSAGGRSSSM